MGFFSEVAANYVQHISVLLEGTGLFLAYTEAMHPKKADSIEAFIYRIGLGLKASFIGERTEDIDFYKFYRIVSKILSVIYFISFASIIIFITIHSKGIDLQIYYQLMKENPGKATWYTLKWPLIVFMLFFVWLAIYFHWDTWLMNLIDMLNQWTDGRALGAFGFILAILGFCGEIYQLLTLHFGQ